jgi:membrane-associated phospholipid phosphatase
MKDLVTTAGSALLRADAAARDAAGPWRDTAFVRTLNVFSKLGDQPPMLTLSAATLAAGLAGANANLTRVGVRMILSHLLATATKNFIKHRVDRRRPRNGKAHPPRPGRDTSKAMTSFPSGHSAGAFAVANAFAREFPGMGMAAQAGAAVIALAQIPRFAHYPTDVAVGSAIGILSEAAVAKILPARARAG